VTVTVDVEDLRTSPDQPVRVVEATGRVLDLLAARDATASVYVVGELAVRERALVRRIADGGHEVGLHAWRHAPLAAVGPGALGEETRRGKEAIEDATGRPVLGYRAPMMSLVPGTAWALEVLGELGFTYSSSVLPAASPLYGWPGLPRVPFRWHTGMVEFPCPVVEVAGLTVPYLGGVYLRVLPPFVRRLGERRLPEGAVAWTYCHPWEFDPDEPFFVYDHVSWLTSRAGWLNRRGMARRFGRLLDEPTGPTLGALAADPALLDRLDVVDGTAAAQRAGGSRRPGLAARLIHRPSAGG
jgi:polysaccharide deacetylase family protein (PEP-CTERM system associated)